MNLKGRKYVSGSVDENQVECYYIMNADRNVLATCNTIMDARIKMMDIGNDTGRRVFIVAEIKDSDTLILNESY